MELHLNLHLTVTISAPCDQEPQFCIYKPLRDVEARAEWWSGIDAHEKPAEGNRQRFSLSSQKWDTWSQHILNDNKEFINFSSLPAGNSSNRNHSFQYLVTILKNKGSKLEINWYGKIWIFNLKKKKKSLQITTPASNVDRFNFPNMGGEWLLKLAPVHATIIFLLLVYFF